MKNFFRTARAHALIDNVASVINKASKDLTSGIAGLKAAILSNNEDVAAKRREFDAFVRTKNAENVVLQSKVLLAQTLLKALPNTAVEP
jgi:hypothetical protein